MGMHTTHPHQDPGWSRALVVTRESNVGGTAVSTPAMNMSSLDDKLKEPAVAAWGFGVHKNLVKSDAGAPRQKKNKKNTHGVRRRADKCVVHAHTHTHTHTHTYSTQSVTKDIFDSGSAFPKLRNSDSFLI